MTTLISTHEVLVLRAARESGEWMTAKEIAKAAGVSRRTAHNHAVAFVDAGVFDREIMFPGHRYRFATHQTAISSRVIENVDRVAAVIGQVAATASPRPERVYVRTEQASPPETVHVSVKQHPKHEPEPIRVSVRFEN